MITVELVQPEVLDAAVVSIKVSRVRLAGPRLELVVELPTTELPLMHRPQSPKSPP